MNILISDNWLREYLKTKASAKEIAEKLSLSGPSVEKIKKNGKDYIYDIEVTTNRVDCMSILGIAREAYVILSNSNFKNLKSGKTKYKPGPDLLKFKIDEKFINRVMAVVMEITQTETPKIIKERLENSGIRSLNSVVDITNYVMQEIGHPTHVFDYDLLKDKKLVFRLSKKGETITTLDGKEHKLPGDDIVIDDGDGNIIDLPGIMGTKNSVVNKNTKRIIFFIDNNDPVKIRRTSTRLGIRTMAAILNEKGVDPELAEIAFNKGIEMYEKICKGKIISKIYDFYPKFYKPNTIKLNHDFIEKIIGVKIDYKKVIDILNRLGFEIKFDTKNKEYSAKVPSWRFNDVTIPEDIVEEVARIYGYQNLPSEIMSGKLLEPLINTPFEFENKIKNILKGFGGNEIYTISLVPKEWTNGNALSLKNPLGDDTKYLRTDLKTSILNAAKENSGEINPFYFFEVANIYTPIKNDLPNEQMTLGIIFANYNYRKAKGIIEALFEELNISEEVKIESLEDNKYFYFEYGMNKLKQFSKAFNEYIPISKYPAQLEDITLVFSDKTKIGDVIKVFDKAELSDIYQDSYTFKVWYEDKTKTLTDGDVEKIRNKYLKEIKDKFGGIIKN